jgi:putative methylase
VVTTYLTLVSSKAELEKALAVYEAERRVFRRELEQYPTPTRLVAHILWLSALKGDTSGRTVADYGCGDGRIAVASLIVGASRAVCVEIDENMVKLGALLALQHYSQLSSRVIFVVGDATRMRLRNVDLVVMNPPFGVVKSNRGLDVKFLLSALQSAKKVYSIHKYSQGFYNILKELSEALNLELEYAEIVDFEIPMLYYRHRRRVHRFKAIFTILARREGEALRAL